MSSFAKIVLCIFVLLTYFQGFSQSSGTAANNEGGIPHVGYYVHEQDSLVPLKYITKETDNKIWIKAEGGVERQRYTQMVSSRDALIIPSETEEHVYYITPITDDICELTVEIILYDEYKQVQLVKTGNKEKKEIIRIYPPKKYMISYERFVIK